MFRTKKALVIAFTFMVLISFLGQEIQASVSNATALFLRIPPSARAWGLGRAYVALADDIGSAYYNPSGLVNIEKNEFMLMYAPWLQQFVDDLHFSYLAYAGNIKGIGQFATHLTFMSLGEQQRTGEDAADLGTFYSYEMALALSYGTYLAENLAVGGTFKYIHSHLSDAGAGSEQGTGVGQSFALDLGVTYYTPIEELTVAAAISNLGPKMAYIDAEQADPLPRTLKVGSAYNIINKEFSKLTITGDLDIDMVGLGDDIDEGFSTIIYCGGAEYWYGQAIGLRAGYYYDDDGEVKSPTFGATIKYQRFQFDFGYFKASTGHPLENQILFTLNFNI